LDETRRRTTGPDRDGIMPPVSWFGGGRFQKKIPDAE